MADNHFRVVSGSAHVDSDLGWIQSHLKADDPPVAIRDVTEALAVIGLCGPRSREVLSAVTDSEVSNAAMPFMTARSININGREALAQRVSYTGELGWELYMPADCSVFIWDLLWQAGQDCGIQAYGYKAVDALRLEKGFAAFGSDLTANDNPYEARLEFCVKLSDADFIGRQALLEKKIAGIQQRLCTLIVGDDQYLTLYGGEAVILEGRVVSRLRSAGYGYTIKKNIGFAYLPVDIIDEKINLAVEIFGQTVTAKIGQNVLYHPERKAL
jgi:4-methylaminobutanoate oxidase (formaldehyde-forming)